MTKRILFILSFALLPSLSIGSVEDDLAAIGETGRIVQRAFLEQDIETILKFHHPEVRKVFSWENYQIGRDDMRAALAGLFSDYEVAFNNEGLGPANIEILGDTAVMIRDFVLLGKPKRGELEAFEYKGRTMLVFVRSSDSPTGWVTFREMAIPARG